MTESIRNRITWIETVGQAASVEVDLRATCKSCGRKRVVPAGPLEGLARLRRWPDSLIAPSCKLRCGTCSSKSVEIKPTEYATDGHAIGPTNDREWRALVRELRD